MKFYSWNGRITTWIHEKCNGGSFHPLKITSKGNSTISSTDRRDNMRIVTFWVDKGQHKWWCFWITWSNGLCRYISDIKIICQRLFLYSNRGCIFFWGRACGYLCNILFHKLEVAKALVESDSTYVVNVFTLDRYQCCGYGTRLGLATYTRLLI